MRIREIATLLEADVLCCEDKMDAEICNACGSDMMSDVLAYVKNQAMLLTGLMNAQAIRTAEMMDMHCVAFVRGKIPDEAIIRLAREMDIVVLSTKCRMYEACGRLYAAGLRTKSECCGEKHE